MTRIEDDESIAAYIGAPWPADPRIAEWYAEDGTLMRFQFREYGAVLEMHDETVIWKDERNVTPGQAVAAPTVEQVPGHVAGALANPKGILLHGTRSGAAGNSTQQEYSGTVNYVRNGTDGTTGWFATIGQTASGGGAVAIHMNPNQYGWHARGASDTYIGCELAQATIDKPISDVQVDALCWLITNKILPVFPNLPHVLKTHQEVEASGETGHPPDGKTDVYPGNDPRCEELKSRIRARLGW